MKRLSCCCGRGLLSLLVLLSASVAAASAAVKFDPREMIRAGEVRPGMKGVGRTVFKGVKIEAFDVTVLGVLPKQNLGGSYVLVRVSGGPITERRANVMQGMSGSPVYINGRMLGAVSATYPFGSEPLGLVTPIEDMLEALDPSLPAKPAWSGRARLARAAPQEWSLPRPVTVEGKAIRRIRLVPDARKRPDGGAKSGTMEMVPMTTPVMVSGLSAPGLKRLSEALQPFGIEAVSGPGGMEYDRPIPLEPGSAAAVSLAVGDVDISAVGTITYRKGGQILAFGHPFMTAGAVDMPLCTAWVHDVVPSVYTSFKLASPVKMVGSVRQDRPWGVAAMVGRVPDLIPVEVNVRDFGSSRRRTLRARVIDNRFLTSQLVAIVTNEAILRAHSGLGDATARVHTEMVTRELGPIRRENLYYGASGIDVASLGDLVTGLNLLSSNPWESVSVREVKVNVDIDSARRTATIERAVADREKYEPGDTVNVDVTLRPWEKEPVKRTLSLKIPEHAPNGRVVLRVSGGAGGGMMMVAPAGQGEGAGGGGLRIGPPPMPPATSLKQLVDHYLEREGNNELVGRLSLPTFTASIEGQKLRTLPPRLLEVMRSPRNSATRLQPDEVKSAEPTPWVVSGMAMITLGIERRVYKEKGGPPAGQPSPPPPSPPGTGEAPRPTTDDDLGDMEDLLLTGGSRQAAGVTGPVAGFPSPVTVPQPAAAFEPVAGPEAAAGDSEAKTPPTPAGAAAAEEKKGADGKDAGGEKKAEVEAPVKAAGRAPVVWRQNTAEAFARGRLDGVAISSRGEVVLAPSLRKDAALDAAYAWSLLAANGAIYAGTGDGGVLYRAAGGKVEPVLKSGELQILALAKDAAGNVYAGTAPSGLVFRVTPGGAGSCFWRSPEEYILSLAVDAQGNVYAGTSPHGRIYRITPDGKGALFATVPDPYVISLAVVGDEVYAGTGADAVVFRIAADGRVRTFFDPGEGATATLVAPDRRGGLFVGTAPRGTVFRVAADGHARMLHEKSAAGITALAEGGPGVVWATAGAVVYRVEDAPREPLVEKIENKDAPTFLALAVDDAGGVALGSATGDIYRLAATQPQRGVFDSAVRDAGSIARPGRLTWIAATPAGTRVGLQTRTGNSEQPDSTWSRWSPAYAKPGQTVTSPPGRYLQYRAVLESEKPGALPAVSEVAVVYLPRNQAPTLTVSAPKTGDAWSRKQTIRWAGSDPDKDALIYNVLYSRDDGATWVKLSRVVKEKGKSGPPAAADGKPAPTPPDAGEAPEEGADAPKPPADGAAPPPAPEPAGAGRQPAAAAPAPLPAAPEGGAPAAAPGAGKPDEGKKAPEVKERKTDSFKETSYAWNTTEVPDGRYLIKVVASDRAGNPADAHTVEKIVGPILISNAAPKLSLAGDPAVAADRSVALAGDAGAGIPLAGVDYRVDEGEWISAAAADGIFDGETERFEIRTQALEAGEHSLEVRAVDAAGNHAEQTRKVVVR